MCSVKHEVSKKKWLCWRSAFSFTTSNCKRIKLWLWGYKPCKYIHPPLQLVYSLFWDNTVINTKKIKLLGVELERNEPSIEISNVDLDALLEMQNEGKPQISFSLPFPPWALWYSGSKSYLITSIPHINICEPLRDAACDEDYACDESKYLQMLSCFVLSNSM